MSKTVYIVMGPTAVGKTSFAITLAKTLGTEIISADARQCYNEMNIGVARPSTEELNAIPHHFIASHSIQENINAAYYENWALERVQFLFQKYDTVVMVGGTGLYIKAFCEGLDMIPTIDSSIRETIIKQYEKLGLRWLQKEVSVQDPLYWQTGEQKNPQRLMRALEVKMGTGKSIRTFQNKKVIERPFTIIKIGLELPREQLYQKINARVIKMLEQGLENEVKNLQDYAHYNALQTVGYSEWKEYFDKKISIEKLIENIQQNTRHYAKRQMTWLKKEASISWYNAATIQPKDIL